MSCWCGLMVNATKNSGKFRTFFKATTIKGQWTRFRSGRKSHLVARIVDRRGGFYEAKFKVF